MQYSAPGFNTIVSFCAAIQDELQRSRRRMEQEMSSLGQSDKFEQSVMEYSKRYEQVEQRLRKVRTPFSVKTEPFA